MAIELRVSDAYPKLYFKRDLTDYCSPYSDPFEYLSILDTPIPDEVFRIIASTAHDTTISDLTARGKIEFDFLVRWAGTAYDPNY